MTFALTSPRVASGVFSECEEHSPCENPYCTGRRYRYVLQIPTGLDNEFRVLWILANPSTATPDKLDPTIRRCVDWAKRWNFGWCDIVNVRAWRATHPESVPPDPRAIGVGPQNDGYILSRAHKSDLIVCGWGKLGGERGAKVLEMLWQVKKTPHALKLNADGSPVHPLYQPGNARPIPMEES